MEADEFRIERGSGNVFADLGHPDADAHLLKAELVARIDKIIRQRGLKQIEAAKISYADATHEPARRHPSMSPMHSSTTSRSGWEPSTIAWAAIGNSSSMSASTT